MVDRAGSLIDAGRGRPPAPASRRPPLAYGSGVDAGQLITVFLTAAGLGAVVGLERQVTKDDTTAGARTFALYAVWGAGAGYFGERFGG